MTHYVDLETALLVAERATGAETLVADYGLLESALARPRSTVLGHDAYPTFHLKAAALLHSLAKNHCLVDGNKPLAWLATVVFCHINGWHVDAPDDEAYDFVIAIADGTLAELEAIAETLERWSRTPDRYIAACRAEPIRSTLTMSDQGSAMPRSRRQSSRSSRFATSSS